MDKNNLDAIMIPSISSQNDLIIPDLAGFLIIIILPALSTLPSRRGFHSTPNRTTSASSYSWPAPWSI
ncbi:hypothetical protein DSO57_1026307 [Entomophthora muscae]|uniref:Uncharacterized protein n=1 Tax=Entomophthora muscae TaxID=34485 RepID=A0ACC2TZZ4_9FUNG|nr:hypothetical protein DSO57_1026307 [Entomophthora muscae]